MKFCKRCETEKPETEMYDRRNCKACMKIYWRERWSAKPEEQKQRAGGRGERLHYDKSNPMAEKAVAVTRLIRRQVFPSPAARMMFAVFSQAVEDSVPINKQVTWEETIDARKYLQGDLRHLEMAGIEPEWARKLLRDQGLLNWNQEAAA